ncbi:MAG: FAD-dependent oxidoreductase [Geminicoccaceae bacterium]
MTECAASLRKRDIDVTVVTPEECPFARLFGAEVGAALLASHEAQGTKFALGDQVTTFQGQDHLDGITTEKEARIPADLAIIGVGIDPVTDFITGVERTDDGGILVDQYLQAAENLFAAGDIAAFTLPLTGQPDRIEHWRLACEHGILAARNMLGQRIAYTGTPFFWSAQKLALYYVGHTDSTADALINGEPGQGQFIAYYSQEGKVVAALGVERNTEMAALQELARMKKLPLSKELVPEFNAVTYLQRIPDI